MTRSARETIELFWETQNSGDYNRLVPLFAADAVVEDPFYGRFEGRDAIAGFIAKMVAVMGAQRIHFRVEEIAGGGDVAWAQWVAVTPTGERAGCGLYRVEDGLLTYYRDYMNPPEAG
jgi:ketosteroid isomerase-like protein